jgi:hypothetical protein
LSVASEIRPQTIEEMFATPLTSPKEAQAILDASERILWIADAHKSRVAVPER